MEEDLALDLAGMDAGDGARQGGLATARLAHQGDAALGANGGVDAVQDLMGAVVDLDAAHGDERILVGRAGRPGGDAQRPIAEHGPRCAPLAIASSARDDPRAGHRRAGTPARHLLDGVVATGGEETALRAVARDRRPPRDAAQRMLAGQVRDRLEELARVGVTGRAEERRPWAHLDQTAGVHHGDAVGEVGHDGEVVGNVERGHLVGLGQIPTVRSTCAWVVTSRPVVGSSSTMTAGRQAKAMAKATRCC